MRLFGPPAALGSPLRSLAPLIALAVIAGTGLAFMPQAVPVLEALRSFPWYLYPLLLGLSLASYMARFSRWLIFFRDVQPPIPPSTQLPIYFSAFALTATPGKVGETIRSLYLRPYGVEYSVSLGAFVSERLLDLLAVGLLTLAGLYALGSGVHAILAVVALILMICLGVRSTMGDVWLRKLDSRAGTSLAPFRHCIRMFLSERTIVTTGPLSIFAWLCQGLSLLVIVRYFGLESSWVLVVSVYSASIIIGAASFIPGGLVATEASITVFLIQLGMLPETALAASLLSRLATLWLAIGLGLAALTTLAIRERRAPSLWHRLD